MYMKEENVCKIQNRTKEGETPNTKPLECKRLSNKHFFK